jgi:hypothetical protein
MRVIILLKPHYSAESRQQIGVECSFADYNQDGEQDLFVCNGIPKRPNDLDYVILPNDQIKSKITTTKLLDKSIEKCLRKCIYFQGSKKFRVLNQSNVWIENDSIISNGVDMQI